MGKKDEKEEEFVIESPSKISSGEVKRYEVRVAPPAVSGGRKVRPVREGTEENQASGSGQGPGMRDAPSIPGAGSQQVFKIEDDLRRTREVMEDLKHTSSILQGEVRDLKAEMERINYLLKSLEGLRNSLKDIESTVSELSGLYDMISANINPFIDIPPMRKKNEPKAPRSQIAKDQYQDCIDPSDVFESVEDEIVDDSNLESDEWILRWIKYLTDKVGTQQLGRTLEYYRRMNWIDESMIQRINEASRGTTAPESHVEFDGEEGWRLDPEDHIKSLEFIKKIKGERR